MNQKQAPETVDPDVLWDFVYDLLDDEQSQQVNGWIRSNPQWARAYADVMLQSAEVAVASTVVDEVIDLTATARDKAPPPVTKPEVTLGHSAKTTVWQQRFSAVIVTGAAAMVLVLTLAPLRDPVDPTTALRSQPTIAVTGPAEVSPRENTPYHVTVRSLFGEPLGEMPVVAELHVGEKVREAETVITDRHGQATASFDTRSLREKGKVVVRAGRGEAIDFAVAPRQQAKSAGAMDKLAQQPLPLLVPSPEQAPSPEPSPPSESLETPRLSLSDGELKKAANERFDNTAQSPNLGEIAYMFNQNDRRLGDSGLTPDLPVVDLVVAEAGERLANEPVRVDARLNDGAPYTFFGRTNVDGALRVRLPSDGHGAELSIRRDDAKQTLIARKSLPAAQERQRYLLSGQSVVNAGQPTEIRLSNLGVQDASVGSAGEARVAASRDDRWAIRLVEDEKIVQRYSARSDQVALQFIPKAGRRYRAEWVGKDQMASIDLKVDASKTPVALRVVDGALRIESSRSEANNKSSNANREAGDRKQPASDKRQTMQLVASRNGVVLGQRQLDMNGDAAEIPLKELAAWFATDSKEPAVDGLQETVASGATDGTGATDAIELELFAIQQAHGAQTLSSPLAQTSLAKLTRLALTSDEEEMVEEGAATVPSAVRSLKLREFDHYEESESQHERATQGRTPERLAAVTNQNTAASAFQSHWQAELARRTSRRELAGIAGLFGAGLLVLLVGVMAFMGTTSKAVVWPGLAAAAVAGIMGLQWLRGDHGPVGADLVALAEAAKIPESRDLATTTPRALQDFMLRSQVEDVELIAGKNPLDRTVRAPSRLRLGLLEGADFKEEEQLDSKSLANGQLAMPQSTRSTEAESDNLGSTNQDRGKDGVRDARNLGAKATAAAPSKFIALPPIETREGYQAIVLQKKRMEGPSMAAQHVAEHTALDLADAEIYLGNQLTHIASSQLEKGDFKSDADTDADALLATVSGLARHSRKQDLSELLTEELLTEGLVTDLVQWRLGPARWKWGAMPIRSATTTASVAELQADQKLARTDAAASPDTDSDEKDESQNGAETDNQRANTKDRSRVPSSFWRGGVVTVYPSRQAILRDALSRLPEPLTLTESLTESLLCAEALENLQQQSEPDPDFGIQTGRRLSRAIDRLAAFQVKDRADSPNTGTFAWLQGGDSDRDLTAGAIVSLQKLQSLQQPVGHLLALAPSPSKDELDTADEASNLVQSQFGPLANHWIASKVIAEREFATMVGASPWKGGSSLHSLLDAKTDEKTETVIGRQPAQIRANGKVLAQFSGKNPYEPMRYQISQAPSGAWEVVGDDVLAVAVQQTKIQNMRDGGRGSALESWSFRAEVPARAQVNDSLSLWIVLEPPADAATPPPLQRVIIETPVPKAFELIDLAAARNTFRREAGGASDFVWDAKRRRLRAAWTNVTSRSVLKLNIKPVTAGNVQSDPLEIMIGSNRRFTAGYSMAIFNAVAQ